MCNDSREDIMQLNSVTNEIIPSVPNINKTTIIQLREDSLSLIEALELRENYRNTVEVMLEDQGDINWWELRNATDSDQQQHAACFLGSLVLLSGAAHCFMDVDLVQNYFREKAVKYATIVGCFTKFGKLNIAKSVMFHVQRISIFNMQEINVAGYLRTQHEQIAVVVDGDCPYLVNFLHQSASLKLIDIKHHWLILSSSTNLSAIFENVPLNIDADVQILMPGDKTSKFVVDIYNPAHARGGILRTTRIGTYNRSHGYRARIKESKYWMRKNMSEVTFKTIVVLPVDFEGTLENYLDSDEHRDVNTFNRFHSRLVYFCRDYYNFSMDISVNKSWGYTNPDGTFDGMVGALERRTIDFGSSPLFVREDRARVIDYGRNTWILRASFIFRNPKSRTSFEIFLKPFSYSIWFFTVLSAIIAILVLKVMTTFENKKYQSNTETSWSISVLVTLGAFCQQGAPTSPRMASGRILTISLFLLSIIIYQFYSASIVSHLLMKPSTSIKNVVDLLNSPLKAGCEDILYNRDYFKHTTDPISRKFLTTKIQHKGSNMSNFLPPEEGLKLVETGNYAFHVEVATAYPIIETTFPDRAICDLKEVQLFRTQPMHANYQKQSPFRDMLDTCLQRLAEHGILYRERRHWHPRKPECIPSARSVAFNVGLDEFYPALVILLIGILGSLAILIAERQISLVQRKPRRRQPKKIVAFPFVN